MLIRNNNNNKGAYKCICNKLTEKLPKTYFNMY